MISDWFEQLLSLVTSLDGSLDGQTKLDLSEKCLARLKSYNKNQQPENADPETGPASSCIKLLHNFFGLRYFRKFLAESHAG